MMGAAVAGRWTTDDGKPPLEAFHVERIVDPFTREVVVGMVRHPGQAFCTRAPGARDAAKGAAWHAIGAAYLSALSKALALSPGRGGWIERRVWTALQSGRIADQRHFGWLAVTWTGPVTQRRLSRGDPSPLGSFRADRVADDGSPVLPRLLVLLAGNMAPEHRLQLGSDIGLRIVLHDHGDEVRIHGVTLSGLSDERALRVLPKPWPGDTGWRNL